MEGIYLKIKLLHSLLRVLWQKLKVVLVEFLHIKEILVVCVCVFVGIANGIVA